MTRSMRLKNLDWIRAIASVAVVAIHYHAIPRAWLDPVLSPAALVNGYFLRLAMPMFVLVSLVLYASKPRSMSDLRQKMLAYGRMAVLWPVIFYLCSGGFPLLMSSFVRMMKSVVASPWELVYLVSSGFETVFYFFVLMLPLFVVLHVLMQKNTRTALSFLILSLLLLAALPHIADGRWAVFYSPLNFVVYVPAALLIVRWPGLLRPKAIPVGLAFLLAGICLAVAECIFMIEGARPFMDGYSKVSLPFLAVGVVLASMKLASSPRAIDFSANHSLQLYLFHTCLFSVVGTMNSILWKVLGDGGVFLFGASAFLMAVMLSYVLSYFIAPLVFQARIYRMN